MNPLLDILAANPTAGNPAVAATPAASAGSPEGMFGMVLAAAVQQAQTPSLAESLMSLPAAGHATAPSNPGSPDIESTAVVPLIQLDLPELSQTLTEATMPTENVIDIAGKTIALVPLLELAENAQPKAGITDPVLPNSENRLTQAVTAWIEQSSPGQVVQSSQLVVPTTVTIDAAEAVSNDEVAAILAQASPVETNESAPTTRVLDLKQLPHDQGTANLKLTSVLQREFPKLNIESVSAKNEYQIKLTPTVQAHELSIAAPEAAPLGSAAQLPVTPSNRLAKPLAAAATVVSRPVTETLATPESIAPNTDETPREIRINPTPAAQAAKTTGFRLTPEFSDDTASATATTTTLGSIETAPKSTSLEGSESGATSDVTYAKTTDLERAHFTVKRVQIDTLLKRGEIKLQLQPEHLGTVKIRLVTTPHETVARLETSSDDARRAVEVSLPQLRESFERAGLKLNQIEVVVGEDSLSRHSQTFDRNPKQPRRPLPVSPIAESAPVTTTGGATGGVSGLMPGLNLLA